MGPRLKLFLAAAFLSLSCGLVGEHGALAQFSSTPSFGNVLVRKKVQLQRRLPPLVNISGKTIAVAVARDNGSTAAELQSAIENFLTRDSAVHVGGTSPDLVIDCRITAYSKPVIKTTTENKVTTNTVTGALSVSFRIGEPHTQRIIASGVASSELDQQVGNNTGGFKFDPFHKQTNTSNINSTLDAENALVADSARQIAAYLVDTPETVEVMLATGGALNAPDRLATNSLWSRNLEDLETLTPYPDPRVDAYRQYNIGVANEALAYAAQDPKAAIKYLQQASIDYGRAIAARPDEKYFLQPQNRIKTALAHYTVSPETAAPAESAAAPAAKPGDTPITDDDVLAMVQAHMDEANILDAIQSAPRVNFDLSVPAQVKLTNAHVNGRILMAMKSKARAASGAR